MRRLVLIAVVLLTITLPGFGTEANPSARQRELIEKLLASMKADNTGKSVMDAFFAQIEKQFLDDAAARGNDPDDIAEAKELFAAFRERAGKVDFNGLMRQEYVRIYAKYFTEQELVDLNAFYSTPTGRKSIEVLPQLMTESMQAGAQHIGPKIQEIMTQVVEDQEKKRPWRRTMSDIRSIATAVEAYATDNDEKYPPGDYAALAQILAPTYIAKFPKNDMWGHEYAYVVSDDGQHYRIVSAGADSIFEWDSRRIAPSKGGEAPIIYREHLEDDLIYADGSFVQLPVQAKGKKND